MPSLVPTHRWVTRSTFTAWFLTAVLACLLAAEPAAAQDNGVTLVRDGEAVAKLYVAGPLTNPEMDSRALRALSGEERRQRALVELLGKAVEDFNYHMEQMSGARLEVVVTDDPDAVEAPAVVIGELANRLGATPEHDTLTGEAYRLLTRDGMVLIGGESQAAFSHGIYTLLYDLGCDWVMPGPEGEVIPEASTVVVSALDTSVKPDWEVRSPWYSGGPNIIQGDENELFQQWLQRQRQTIRALRSHPAYMEGGHFWNSLIRGNRELLTENPEMRALIRQPDGTLERGWAQLEPTSEAVVDLTVQWVRDRFEANDWPKDHAAAFSIGPNDGGGYSASPEAIAAGANRNDPITGDADQTDVLILYANRVLERLEDEFPNLKLGFYIYSVHADYPQRYTPHPNFVGHIADITYSRYHSTLDRRSTTRNYFRNVMEQWGRLAEEQGNVLWFYGYNWNLAENLMPYSKMKIWGQDLPFYHSIGVKGHNNEQDKAWSILGPHNYLMARMGWDMSLDWREILTEYCGKAFGKGGPEMEAYYLDLIDTQEKGGHEAGSYHAMHLIFDRDFIERSRQRFERATAAADTDHHKRMIDYFGQAVTALEIYLDYRDAVTGFDFTGANEQVQNMIAHWEAYHEQNPHLVSRYGRRYLNWLFVPYVEQGMKYSTGDYRIIHRIPDQLPTIFDPNIAGQLMGFYEPAKPDNDLLRTRTWGSTWDAQGLGPVREGAVWYRVAFDLDEDLADEPVGLYVGAVEDAVHVWCNGEYVGMGRRFIRPFTFDLTDFIKPGQENLVAMQVIRYGKLNEAGLGGLLYPSFVFTGPRLEQVAPEVAPLERILPGGGREAAPE